MLRRKKENTKPLWFLDIDGVINGFSYSPDGFDDSWEETLVQIQFSHPRNDIDGTYRIRYSTELIDFINRVQDKVDIVWLTSWVEHANNDFAPAVGIFPDNPSLSFPEMFKLSGVEPVRNYGQTLFSKKMEAVVRMLWGDDYYENGFKSEGTFSLAKPPADIKASELSQRPVIWTDDELTFSVKTFMKNAHSHPSLVICPNAETGLNPQNLKDIEQFIDDNS